MTDTPVEDNQEVVPAQDAAEERQPKATLVTGAPIRPLVPRNIDEVLRYAKILLLAGAVPDSLTKAGGRQLPEKEVVARVIAVIAAGSEVGMGPMASMANIALINNRRSIWGQAAVALIQSKGVLEEMRVEPIGAKPAPDMPTAKFADDFGIRVTLKRRGQETAYVGVYTVGMAKRAHLWMNQNKKPWVESPERQLQWRAFHFAATDGFADCLMGMMIREVAEDLPPNAAPSVDTTFLDDTPAITEGSVEKGGVNPTPSQIEQRPPDPGPTEGAP